MKILNQHLNYPKAQLIEPNLKGYIHIGIELDYSRFPFYLFESKKKKDVIKTSKEALNDLLKRPGVEKLNLFKAIIKPPIKQPLNFNIAGQKQYYKCPTLFQEVL